MKKIILLFILGASLMACSFGNKKFISVQEINMNQEKSYNVIDSIVAPYKEELAAEMNVVLAQAKVDFINKRPSGNLGNLLADIFLSAYQNSDSLPQICVINFGGLRTSLNKGEITVGDIYKVMPFDNQIYRVKMPAASIVDIVSYLKNSGGEPIAGFKIVRDQIYDEQGNPWNLLSDFYVVTSDYLFMGGDKMDFFKNNISFIQTGDLMRDVLLTKIAERKVLNDNNQERIILK